MRHSPARHLRLLVVAFVATACATPGGAPAGGTATPTQAVTTTPAPSAAAATASPAATALPAESLDPAMSAAELLAETTTAAAFGVQERSRETRGDAIVRDVTFIGADGSTVPAYVIGPATVAPKAGVVFLHWLGDVRSDREEFVDEAVSLASNGVESVLITQTFPWVQRPSGVDRDRVAIGLQVRTIRRAATLLAGDVGTAKLALVGHDFGCMHGLLAASVDDRLAAVACMTPTATWADWFVQYFHVTDAAGAPAYAAAMADLDPVTRIADVHAPLLLQFASADFYVPSAVVTALSKAAPKGTEVRTYDADHQLGEAARTERDAWLLQRLGVSA